MLDIYVINIKERVDRKEKLLELFKEYVNINLIFVEAIKHENGAIGCFLSHKKCLKIAKEKNLKNIIVLEDDCMPATDFYNRLIKIKEYLDKKNNWDILLGGVFKISSVKLELKDTPEKLYYIKRGCCTQLVFYNNKSYDFFLNYDETSNPIDHAWHNNFFAILPIPFLAYQYDSFSTIQNKWNGELENFLVTYENRIKDYINNNKIKLIEIN